MNPTTPTSAMSQGGTFMRPGAIAWGQPGQAGHPPAEPATPVTVEHALAAAAKDPDRVTDLLDELSRGRLWLPLPEVRPVTDGSAVVLPTVTYLGAEFVPAFTSAGRLAGWLGQDPVPPFAAMPHIVVPVAELARRMPSGVGIALNPDAEASVPIYPEGVGYLAATLVVSVTLDDPGSHDAHQEVLDAVQWAVAAVPELRFPVDVTFPGENEPDQVDAWISAYAEPFYIRS
jgi:hypothetical protein